MKLRRHKDSLPEETIGNRQQEILPRGSMDSLDSRQTISDNEWQAAFESLLRFDLRENADQIRIEAGKRLDFESMSRDYRILIGDGKGNPWSPGFRHFRKYNIIECKNPDDMPDMRTLYKACGYAWTYMGLEEHEMVIFPDEVTVTIIRHQLDDRTRENLVKETEGIYRKDGFFLPVYIVVTEELKDPEYSWAQSILQTGNGEPGDHRAKPSAENL